MADSLRLVAAVCIGLIGGPGAVYVFYRYVRPALRRFDDWIEQSARR